MKKVLQMITALALCIPLLSGCTGSRTTVAYTIYPIQWLIKTISGSSINCVSIQKDTPVVVQRAQLRSDYRDVLSNAKAFFHIGNLEPYQSVMSTAVKDSGASDVDLSSLNAVYDFARYTKNITDGEIKYTETSYYSGTIFDSINVTSKDLTLWNDPISMLSMAEDILDWLQETYPDNADEYQKNFDTLETDLINLDAQYQSYSSEVEDSGKEISFVTMTASFGTWQKTYGFQVYPLILSRYGVLPNEAQLEAIEARIKKDGVKYIVYETNMTDDMIELFDRVQQDCNLERVDLSNLSALSEEQQSDGKDYISIMYENLAQLETLEGTAIPTNDTTTAG